MSRSAFGLRRLAAVCGLIAWGLAGGWAGLVSGAEPPLRAGAAVADITPEAFPISVNGNLQNVLAESAADPLSARCLVLDDGTTRLAFVVVDSCAIDRPTFESAKAQAEELTGIPASHMLLSATHTHSAPAVVAVFQSEPDAKYKAFLARRIAAGVKQAFDRRVAAKIGWGSADLPGEVFNRRWKLKPGKTVANPFGVEESVQMNPGYGNPQIEVQAGPVDPQISLLSVQTADGKPLAVLANYSLHYVGGTPAGAVSADYFGEFCERLGAELKAADQNPEFVAMMSNGTSGDVNNVNFSLASPPKFQTMEKIRLVSQNAARAAAEGLAKIEYHDRVKLGAAVAEVELGVRKPNPKSLAAARERLDKATNSPLKTAAEIYAREAVLLAEYPDTVKVNVQAMRVGELGIAAIPCEVFTEIGLEIKRRSALKPAFTISLANGYFGYLPTPEQHALGGYETWPARSSFLATDSSPKIVAAILQLMETLHKQPAR